MPPFIKPYPLMWFLDALIFAYLMSSPLLYSTVWGAHFQYTLNKNTYMYICILSLTIHLLSRVTDTFSTRVISIEVAPLTVYLLEEMRPCNIHVIQPTLYVM